MSSLLFLHKNNVPDAYHRNDDIKRYNPELK